MENFFKSLQVMLFGMGGIFLFMLVFYFVTKGLDRFFPKKEDEEKSN